MILAPEPGSVRVGPICAIPGLVKDFSDEPLEVILEAIGVSKTVFDSAENSISFVAAGQLLEQCMDSTSIPHFGLLVGMNAIPGSLGQLFNLAMAAPTVRTALQAMIQHICLNDRGGIATLQTNAGVAKLGYAVYVPMVAGVSQIYDVSMAVICNLMRSFYGARWSPSEVLLAHSRPVNSEPYERFFKAKLYFDADEYAHVFPETILDQKIPGGSEGRLQRVLEEIEHAENMMDIDFVERVRSVVYPLLVSQYCSHDLLANTLSMHPRTMDRKLRENGLSFRSMISEARYDIARQLLAYSRMSVLRIAVILGYAEASVFTRAFRKWSGATPTEWRARAQAQLW